MTTPPKPLSGDEYDDMAEALRWIRLSRRDAVESAIDAVKSDKQSTWEQLARRLRRPQ